MNTIQLPRTIVNQLLAHAQSRDAVEVCGLISSKHGHPARCYPIPNTASNPRKHFTMDEHAQIDAMRTIREQGEALFAIYHSHPHAPAQPSAEDLQHDEYPEALRLIVSLNTKGVLELRAFSVVNGRAEAVGLELSE
ncbi:MAG: M67 family metallopeptidase [Pseudomonadota bacterium]